jgi:hypothetical protein
VTMTRHPAPPAATRRRRGVAAVVLGALLSLSVALPAAAHPFLRGGGEVPVDSLATVTLDLAHGCGSEATGAGQDTLEVALEVPDWLRVVAVADHPGYVHDLEVDQGRIVVVAWEAAAAPEPAPTFDLDVVASGTPGETRHLAVFQGCADAAYRWIGTPDAPADDPAINVRLVAADPDRPAPPPEPIDDSDPGGDAEIDPDPEGGGDEPGSETDGTIGDGDDVEDAADPIGADDGAGTAEAAPAGASPDGDDAGPWRVLVWAGGVLALLAAAGVLFLVVPARRRADR